MNIKSLLLITILLPISTFSMENEHMINAKNEAAALAIGAACACITNIVHYATIQEAILYNVAALGLSSFNYSISESLKVARSGKFAEKKYLYFLGGFVSNSLALLCLKQAIIISQQH